MASQAPPGYQAQALKSVGAERRKMGFGTLFIGYFFLINISYYAYTDIIAGLVMLLGLYRLTNVNKSFQYGSYTATIFSAVAFYEIIASLITSIGSHKVLEAIMPYVSSLRYALIFALSYFILKGIEAVAREVQASALSSTARASVPLSCVFLVYAAFEIPFISGLFGSFVAYIFFTLLLAVVFFVISNLVTIYKAYMQICMPEDLKKEPKQSKFEFVNRFYDSIEKKSREYAEYKLNKKQNKNKKGKK